MEKPRLRDGEDGLKPSESWRHWCGDLFGTPSPAVQPMKNVPGAQAQAGLGRVLRSPPQMVPALLGVSVCVRARNSWSSGTSTCTPGPGLSDNDAGRRCTRGRLPTYHEHLGAALAILQEGAPLSPGPGAPIRSSQGLLGPAPPALLSAQHRDWRSAPRSALGSSLALSHPGRCNPSRGLSLVTLTVLTQMTAPASYLTSLPLPSLPVDPPVSPC